MTPEQLHRAVLTATAFGDAERYARLRERFGPHDARSEFEHLEGAAAACLAYRLGPPDAHGEPAEPIEAGKIGGPIDADGAKARGRNEFGALMAELRAAGPEYGPPANLLELEGVIRGLRGEHHHMAEIGGDRMRAVFRFLVRYLTATVPEIRDDFDEVVRRAREHIMRRLMG